MTSARSLLDVLTRAAERLEAVRMAADVETMIEALRRGLVDAADFARYAGFNGGDVPVAVATTAALAAAAVRLGLLTYRRVDTLRSRRTRRDCRSIGLADGLDVVSAPASGRAAQSASVHGREPEDPRWRAPFDDRDESTGPLPDPRGVRIEAAAIATPCSSTAACKLYVLFALPREGAAGASARARRGAAPTEDAPRGWTSADAAGLPILPLLAWPGNRSSATRSGDGVRDRSASMFRARHFASATTIRRSPGWASGCAEGGVDIRPAPPGPPHRAGDEDLWAGRGRQRIGLVRERRAERALGQ